MSVPACAQTFLKHFLVKMLQHYDTPLPVTPLPSRRIADGGRLDSHGALGSYRTRNTVPQGVSRRRRGVAGLHRPPPPGPPQGSDRWLGPGTDNQTWRPCLEGRGCPILLVSGFSFQYSKLTVMSAKVARTTLEKPTKICGPAVT